MANEVGRVPGAWIRRRDSLIGIFERGDSGTIALIKNFASDLDAAFDARKLTPSAWAQLKFTSSSMLINLGDDHRDRDAVESGIRCAQDALEQDGEPQLAEQLQYNIANGRSALHKLNAREWKAADPTLPPGLIALRDREMLRHLRRGFSVVGYSAAHDDTRGRALCNLGNELDHSGRWVEAYQAYVDALTADPTNGNAAGNAAEMLRIRVARGRGLSGHYAALYDKYREQALKHRDRTVELAGEDVAKRWDALPPSGSQGHVSHDGDPLDGYQQWIKQHRLALTLAVEGLGSDNPRWDDALVQGVTVPMEEPDPPRIFTSMNVLKAEYLVARRLAFDGEVLLNESPFAQHPSDSGTYSDTLDMSLYGETPARLVLAQRATLDLLDKIAVAANDHFETGLVPRVVNFAKYWREPGSDVLRDGLPVPDKLMSAGVALAELAFDMDPAGMYPAAKTLRNAGTHRLVNLTWGEATGATELAHSSVDARSLIEATREALRVARAAYIYLIDLVQDQQDALPDDEHRPQLPIYDQP
ncbi:LA2681 family HEPN domain-containing protein [Pseudolysinimonas sp.]|uniref:LA2681 family HEPN domain-containing protein n=1 Tax=Pseudolysinimonas sp. TaxID=2680009 RepID=UPI003F7F165E